MRLDTFFSKRTLALVVCLLFYALFFTQKTNLMASDLGRHISNGNIILAEKKVFSTNRYSLTQSERYAPNHHWLFGVVAALTEKVGGFPLITVLTASMYTAAVAVSIFLAVSGKHRAQFAIPIALLVLPTLTDRAEVRPEAFSLLFIMLLFVVMWLWERGRMKTVLAALSIGAVLCIWVNMHIFFILAVAVVGSFFVQLVATRQYQKLPGYFALCAAALVGSLINPLGLLGALYPFRIFSEYAYPVAENQTLFFLLQRFPTAHYYYTAGICVLFAVVLLLLIFKYRDLLQKNLALVLITAFFCAATLRMIRFENVLTVFCIPHFTWTFERVYQDYKKRIKKISEHPVSIMAGSLVGLTIGIAAVGSGLFVPFSIKFGIGLFDGSASAGKFLQSIETKGPMFNNFDAGSYLIYYLYPKQKVFVDNRAEAYSADFLRRYKLAQEDEAVWQQLDDAFQFGMIAYYRLENTEWSQQFMIARVRDDTWVPIYVDDFALILVRNIPEHQQLIEKYKLPQSIFQYAGGGQS